MIEAGASVLRRMLGVYGSSKMGVLLLLGFSSGLPLLLINTTLNAWLTQAGLTTIAIGLFNLLNLPYSFKFLWSPVLDRFLLPAPGSLRGSRRRGWMALTQVLLLLSIGLLGFQDPTQTWLEALGWEELSQTWPGITVFTRPIFLVGLLVAFLMSLCDRQFSATQYALLTSVFAVGGTLAGAVSGYLAAAVNWPLFYLITAMTAAPAMVILLWLGPPSSTAALATAAKGEASEP